MNNSIKVNKAKIQIIKKFQKTKKLKKNPTKINKNNKIIFLLKLINLT